MAKINFLTTTDPDALAIFNCCVNACRVTSLEFFVDSCVAAGIQLPGLTSAQKNGIKLAATNLKRGSDVKDILNNYLRFILYEGWDAVGVDDDTEPFNPTGRVTFLMGVAQVANTILAGSIAQLQTNLAPEGGFAIPNYIPEPNAPTGVTVTVTAGLHTVNWNTVEDATSYTLQSKITDGEYTEIYAGTETTFEVSNLNLGAVYSYRVFAVGMGGTSTPSITIIKPTQNSTPTNLTADLNSSWITINWVHSDLTVKGYEIQRSSDAGASWITLNIASANTRSYLDAGVMPGAEYKYRISAKGQTLDSDWSNELDVQALGGNL